MKKTSGSVLIFLFALLFALASPRNSFADEWNKSTKLTFSEPVEVPGLVLPAGTYWFTLMDDDADRHIVRIWNADRTQLVTTILAIPDSRLQPTDNTIIKFAERPAGSPEAIHAWFYPGDDFGQEFVYPKTRATELAKQTNRPVLSMPDQQASDATQVKKAPVAAVAPSGEEVAVAEVITTQPAATQSATLPQTASPLPLLALLGALALAGAGLFRMLAREAR